MTALQRGTTTLQHSLCLQFRAGKSTYTILFIDLKDRGRAGLAITLNTLKPRSPEKLSWLIQFNFFGVFPFEKFIYLVVL